MNDSPQSTSYRARWVIPGNSPPIAQGAVTVDRATNRIVAVGEAAVGAQTVELGDVVLLPAFINAHTHLEFSDLPAPLGMPGTQFAAWIRQVIELRRASAASGEDLAQRRARAVRAGLDESLLAQVAAVGEIATPGWPVSAFSQSGRQDVVFLELLGLAPERQDGLLAAAREHVTANQLGSLRGLSPHAPYTASPELVRQACELSREFAAPVAMHLAESWDEMELLRSHCGALVELLDSLEAWFPSLVPRGIEPRQYLELLAEAHRALIIHGNFLQPDDWEFLAQRREWMTLVHCPRTHAFFGRGKFPLRELLDAGVQLALGTDSRASNPDLSMLAEMRWLRQQHADVGPAEILALGTQHAAAALGLAADLGSLECGKLGKFATLPLNPNDDDPWKAVFAS